ncbi:DUF1223 domain-containing protein [Octadecabacter sp. CECT 8868]|uniref:DUF1223 domain-containing protein n=1 Tax=Octadecabacter algicola TaxID=2909342 RepID=UPI001F351E19|nr:DUF1223 domain-containing protein [Octadecabacter algicola]MCF2903501.1 DUF1223 domain-containing protein [Octadecabacter algicola]
MRKTFAALASCIAFATPAVADGPVVVELYTSQGCSSCPPADAILLELAARSDVLALALHVDYWDYIGWADTFGSPAFTRRQQQYAHAAGDSTIYTPQMVIAGRDHVIGTKPMEVSDLIRRHSAAQTGVQVAAELQGNQLRITGTSPRPFDSAAMVQVVRFDPEQTVDIGRGENQGRSIRYANIVTDWQVVGEWGGREGLDQTVRLSGNGAVAVIVQTRGPRNILATAVLR